MIDTADRAIAIVGLEAVMPGARDGAAFWQNIKNKVYSISEVHPDRWDPALYYDADIAAPDKCYTKLGGWVRDFEWEPMKWRLPIPPKVSEQLDDGQRWSVALSRGALRQAGRSGTSTTSGWPSSLATPSAARSITRPACGSSSRSSPASCATLPASRPCRRTSASRSSPRRTSRSWR